jgi:hypothetical protein
MSERSLILLSFHAWQFPNIDKIILTYFRFKKEGRSINSIGWLYWDEEKMPAGSTASGQYGVGKSLAHAAGEWASLQPGVAYCEFLPSCSLCVG